MEHGLSRARSYIEYRPVSMFDIAITCNLRCRQMTAADQFGMVSLRFLQSGEVLLRDNQNVRRRLRIDVLKSKYVLVLVNFLRWNLAAQDAAEKAIAGSVTHCWVTTAKR